jgi:hypothetical protein
VKRESLYLSGRPVTMNKRQRKRAKKREEQKRRGQQNETQEHDTVRYPLGPGQSPTIANTVKPKPIPPARPHALTITFSFLGSLLTGIAFYWNVAQPDIRYIPSLGPEAMTVLESKVDGSGNFIHSIRLRPTFTNYSIKPGFIDKAEFVPQSIATLPDVKIISIDKILIFWHQEKQIEITLLMTIPTDAINNLNTTRELAVDQVLAVFDNTGKKVDHLPNGMFGRIRFNFKEVVKIQVNRM